ncbi:MAG: GtrA family protein, partial [Actinomycetota bacterium]
AWLGNRYWTFSGKRSATAGRELVMFVLVNVGGMLVAVATLWFSYYVLGLTSPVAVNVSANIVGVALGTIFRYVCYRYWVFSGAAVAAPPRPALPAGSPRPDPAPSEDRSGRS